MSNDPNDRFMISDLSSKLSAYINGEQSSQASQTRDPADIEDVFASEIKPADTGRKFPGDDLFTDLDQALDSRPVSSEESYRKQKLAEEQRRAEDARRQQLRNEQLRQQRFQEEQKRLREEQQRQLKLREEQLRLREEQQRQLELREEQLRQQQIREEQQRLREEQQRQLKLREEQLRQLKLREEQLRQQQIREEQLRQLKLRQEKALARTISESLYSFDPDATYKSVRSGHPVPLTKLASTVKSMPSEAALRKALAKTARTDLTKPSEAYYEAPQAEKSYDAPQSEIPYAAPQSNISYEAPQSEISYEAPQAENAFTIQTTPEPYETADNEAAYISQPQGESRYAKSPDPTYKGYQEERKGSRIGVFIALLIAFLAVAAIFIMLRRYSSNLTNLLNGKPAAGTTETVSKAESEVESETESATENESGGSEYTDNNPAGNTEETINNMAINEEGEIFHADSLIADTEIPDAQIPEDPNDITYLASVNQKAAEDAITELSEAAPRLYLSTYGIKINAGDSFNALSFVERIEDDSDARERLFRDISIDGLNEFDAKTIGTYELTYFCYDSAGNRSNRAKLTVIVE